MAGTKKRSRRKVKTRNIEVLDEQDLKKINRELKKDLVELMEELQVMCVKKERDDEIMENLMEENEALSKQIQKL